MKQQPNQQVPPRAMSDAQAEELRAEVKALVDAGTVTRREIHQQTEMSSTTLSQWLNGHYKGRKDVIAERIRRWLHTLQSRQDAQDHLLQGPNFVMTPTASRIFDAISYADHARDVVLIHGGAGIGKTKTLKEYRDQHSGVCLSTMTPAHVTVANAIREIGNCYGVRTKRETASLFESLVRVLQERRGLLLVDEAQHLSYKALDAVRQIHDAAECGLVLCGNDNVYTGLTATRSAEYLDRLASRIGMRLSVKSATTLDCATMLDAWKIKDKEVRDVLQQIARKPGGLRLVDKVIRCAHIYSEDDKVHAAADLRPDDIRHAWELLGLGGDQ